MDFLSVQTATFRVLYVFFVIHHERRQILHFSVSENPDTPFIIQQLREAFPYDTVPRYLVLDRDTKFNHEDRTHLTPEKDTPAIRPTIPRLNDKAHVISLPRLGGLHHRYTWSEVA
jgi:hypothetical protein